MSGVPNGEIQLRQFLRGSALTALIGRLVISIALIVAGFAGLSFLLDAQSTGPGRLQVNESVQGFVASRALVTARIGLSISLMVEVLLYVLTRTTASWSRLIWIVPLFWSFAGAALAWEVLWLDELDIVPKVVMLMVGGAVVLFLTVSMQATLWQAAFGVAPEVTDFPYVWYLLLVMMMSAFFGGFKGWTDASPMVREVIEYRRRNWAGEREIDVGRPVPERWIQ
jgi:hypothetical protein